MYKNTTKKINRSTLIFIVSYYIYLVGSIWAQTAFATTYGETFINLLQWVAIILVVMKIVLDRRVSEKNLPVWILFLMLCLIISTTSANYRYVIPVAAYILAGSNIDSDILIKTALHGVIVMIIFTMISSLIGIVSFEYTINAERIRYNLGFAYTTYSANYFFHALLMWLFIKKKCPNIAESIIVLVINYVIYRATGTKAVYYETVALIMICWGGRLMRKDIDESKLRYALTGSFGVCAVIAFYLQINYNPSKIWMSALNLFASYRLSLGHLAYNIYGLSLLGQQVEWRTYNRAANTSYFYVDSSYLNIGITYGVIWLLFLLIGFTFLIKKYVSEKKLYCCLALTFLAIHSISDPQLYSLICNPFMFLLGSLFPYSNRGPKNNYKNLPIEQEGVRGREDDGGRDWPEKREK